MAKKHPSDWLEDIDDALDFRREFAREDAWRRIEQNFYNDPNGHTAVGPNLIHSMGDSLVSSLGILNPEFTVSPETRSGVEKAPIIESLDNCFVRKLRLKQYVNRALLNGYLYGSMILKLGYDSEFGWNPFYDMGSMDQPVGATFTQFDKSGKRIETPDTQPGWPWVRPVLPHDFVVPWGTIDLADAPWVAHRLVRRVSDLQADRKYKNTSKLQGQITMADHMMSYLTTGAQRRRVRNTMTKAPRPAEFVELWEIRDRMTGTIKVVVRQATGAHRGDSVAYDKYLRDDNDALQLACGLPFVGATLNPHTRSFWTTPPAYYLGQLQKTQFDISLQAEKQRRINVLRFLYRKGALSATALSRLLSAGVGAAEGVEGHMPLNEVVQALPQGNLLDLTMHAEHNRRNAREAIGFSRNQLGEFDASSRRTAKETLAVAAGAQRRNSRKEETVSDFYIEAMEKVNKIVFVFWKLPRQVMSHGRWQNVTGPMLQGDYQYSLSLTSKRSISKAERKVEALTLLQTLLPLMQIDGFDANDAKALMEFIVSASGDPSFESLLMSSGGQRSGGGQAALMAGGGM